MPPILPLGKSILYVPKQVVRTVGIGKTKVFTYPAVVWYPNYWSIFNQPDQNLFYLSESIAKGTLIIPKQLIDINEHMKVRIIIDKSKIGKAGYTTQRQWNQLIAEMLESRIYTCHNTLVEASDSQLGLFVNYIMTKAGIRWQDRSDKFVGKDSLRGIKGANEADRLRVITAGIEGLLYGVVSYEPDSERSNPVCYFIKYVWGWIDKYIKKEMWNIRGERYGLVEEMELSMRAMLSGSYTRYRVIAKAVNRLEKCNKDINVGSVTDELLKSGVSPKTFGNRNVKDTIFKVLNPVKAISFEEYENIEDFAKFIPLHKSVLEISSAISHISNDDIEAMLMGRPQALTIRYFEGYDILMVMRNEFMEALGETCNKYGHSNGNAFTSKEAELLDILFFDDLPLENEKYVDQTNWVDLCKLRAELEFTKDEYNRRNINKKIKEIKSQSYIEIPEVKGEFSSPYFGMIKQIPLRGFKNTWINRSAYKLALSISSKKGWSVTGKLLAECIDFTRNFVFKLRRLGYLDQNHVNCLPCIRLFHKLEHGFSDDYTGIIPGIRYGSTMVDLAEDSQMRKDQDLKYWKMRQQTVTSERVCYDFEGLRLR